MIMVTLVQLLGIGDPRPIVSDNSIVLNHRNGRIDPRSRQLPSLGSGDCYRVPTKRRVSAEMVASFHGS